MDRRAQRQGSASWTWTLSALSGSFHGLPRQRRLYTRLRRLQCSSSYSSSMFGLWRTKWMCFGCGSPLRKELWTATSCLCGYTWQSGFQNHYKSETKSVLWCNNLIFNLSHNVVKWHLGLGWNDYFLKVLHHNGYNNKQVMERSWSCF